MKLAFPFVCGLLGIVAFFEGRALAAAPDTTTTSIVALSPVRTTGFSGAGGTAIEGLPLLVPPGRKHVQPNLSLLYSSLGGEGEAGLGWSLETGSIDRSPAYGIPAGADPDEFTFSLGGGADTLVSIGGGAYRPRFESTYRQYQFLTDHWQVTDSEGTVYSFGSSASTRIAGLSWALDRIQDTNGNLVTLTYSNDGGYLIPASINYTGNAITNEAGTNNIVFQYQPRPDVTTSNGLGPAQTRQMRLWKISETAGTSTVRTYVMNYATSPSNGRSLLSEVDMVGSDNASTLVLRKYTYQNQPAGYSSTALNNFFPVPSYDSSGNDTGTRMADVNGDGFVDVVDNGSHVWLNDGNGNFNQDADWSASLARLNIAFVDNNNADTGTRLLDINGDLRPDIIVSAGSTQLVYTNNGAGWRTDASSAAYQQAIANLTEQGTTQAQYLGVSCDAGADDAADAESCDTQVPYTAQFQIIQSQGASNGVSFADVNGDGLVDIVWSFQDTSFLYNLVPDSGPFVGTNFKENVPATIHGVWLNNGAGFTRSSSYSESLGNIPPFVMNTQIQGFDVFDVNGDGIADVVNTHTPQNGTDPRGVWLGSASLTGGYAFTQSASYTAALQASGQDLVSFDGDNSLGLVPEDYNHDGLMDYVRASPSDTVAYRNTGAGWTQDSAETAIIQATGMLLVDSSSKPGGYAFVDVNGDGADDLVAYRDGVGNFARLGFGPAADLLQQSKSLLGETASLTYTPCNRFSSLGSDGLYHLPMAFSVVTGLTRFDGLSATFPSTVTYQGGVIGALPNQASRFLSFTTSTLTDSRGVQTVANFATDAATAGAPLTTTTIDTTNTTREIDSITYNEVAATTGVTQIQVAQTDQQRFDPGGSTHTRIVNTYDTYLNVVELFKAGDLSVTGDEGTTVFTYAQNPSAGIVSALASATVYDATGALHSQSTMLYDGQTTAGSVSAGNVTSIVDYVGSGAANVERFFDYDTYGNPVMNVDRNDGVSTFTYDTATHAFVASTVDAMGRTSSSVTDARFGAPTDQVDPNGNQETRTYDAFGRLLVDTLPGDAQSPNGTRSYSYSAFGSPPQTVTIASTITPSSSTTSNSTASVDGFGQQILLTTPADGGQSVFIATTYDDVGNIATQSEPYFSTQTPVFATTTRDALRRVTSLTDVLGVTTTTAYSGLSRSVTDGRGNTTTYESDAYGHDVAVDQFVGGQEYTTQTTYNVVGNRVSVTDAAGDVTSITYDGLERRTAMSEPNVGSFTYAYDANGNVTSQSGPTGTIQYTYDADNEVLTKVVPGSETVTYAYGTAQTNGVGKASHIVDDAGTLDLAYDVRGRIASKTRTIWGVPYTTKFSFDSQSRLTSLTYPDGYVANYSYGASGLVEGITDGNGNPLVTSITYDADSKPTSFGFGNGITTTYTRDAADLMTSFKTVTAGGTVLQNRALAYDADRNVTSITDSLTPSLSQAFTYDAINRITNATGGYGQQVFQYDSVGNFVKKGNLVFQRDPNNHQQVTCAIDLNLGSQLLNGLAEIPNLLSCAQSLSTSSALSSADQTTLKTIVSRAAVGLPLGQSMRIAYNAAGNMLERGDLRMTYDAENHLVAVGNTTDLGQEFAPNQPGYSLGVLPIESNVYDSVGGRVIQQFPTGDSITYIDGIWELEQDPPVLGIPHVRRNISIGNTIVATVTDDGPGALHAGLVPLPTRDRGGPSRTLRAMADELQRALGAGPSAMLIVAAALAALVLVVGPRRRRQAVGAVRGSISLFPRRPFRFAFSLALAMIQLVEWSPAAIPEARANIDIVNTYYYHLDHIGNTNLVTDEFGGVVEAREYKPFGEQFIRTGATLTGSTLETSLNGHEFDPSTNLYYFGARHYDPLTGRFVTADTQVNHDIPQGLHRYAFNLNNPIRFVDYNGHFSVWDIVTGFLAAVLVVAGIVIAVATFGAATPLSVVMFGVAIGLVTAGVTLAVAYYGFYLTGKISIGDVVALTFAGFFLGATTGAASGAVFAGGYFAGAASSLTLTSDVALGAATGSVSAAAEALIDKANPEQFLLAVFAGAVVGGLIGAGTYAVGAALLPNVPYQAPGLYYVYSLQQAAAVVVQVTVWDIGQIVLLCLNTGISGISGWLVEDISAHAEKKAPPTGTPQGSVGTNAMNTSPAMM
jgi:RHS repeat-associated protein